MICLATTAQAWSTNTYWDCRGTADGAGWACQRFDKESLELKPITPVIRRKEEQAPAVQDTDQTPEEITPYQPAQGGETKEQTGPTAETEEQQQLPPPASETEEQQQLPAAARETAAASARDEEDSAPPVAEVKPTEATIPEADEPPAPSTSTTSTQATETEEEPTAAALTDTAADPGRMDIDAGLDWSSCATPIQPAAVTATGETDETIHITADSAEAVQADETAVFSGDVHLSYQDQTIYADNLAYDRRTELVTSPGHILIQSPSLRVAGDQASYNLTTRQGQLSNAEYRILERQARGNASLAQGLGERQARFEDISFTTCPPGNSDFMLSAKELHIDQANAIGTFRGAKLELLGIPLFYFPSMTIPLNDQRKSGFLIPSVGYSSKNGVDISAPYYLNLAPDYDATLVPRLVSKRGAMLGGEFRFLSDNHRGEMQGEILPDDRKYQGSGARGAFHLKTHSVLAPRFTGNVTVNYVSDNQYLEDLGDSLAVSSTRHLLSNARLDYHADKWDFLAELRHYKTLDESISEEDRPYSQLPRMRLDMVEQAGPAGFSYSLLSEYTYFYKDTGIKGHRVDILPAVSLPVRNSWSYVEPMVTARYTGYRLSNQEPGQDDSPDRALATFSLDSGLFFDRSANWFGNAITQTLEPRAYYLYVPYEDQSDLPVFDTGLLDFNFDNLFRLNRFNGADRVGDANQFTLALSSSVLSDGNGAELMRASIGQIFYFRDREVTLPGETVEEDSSSAFLGQISARLDERWSVRAGVQVDPHTNDSKIRQGLAQATYRGDSNQLFNAAYRLREGVVEQTDLAMIWPISENTSLIGRWYYSLQEDKTLEAVAGIEYGRCCWRIRAVLRHYLDDDTDTYNNSAMLQIVLRGLGELGSDINNYLDRSIYGYQTDNDN